MNQSRRLTPIALGLAAILILGGSIAAAAVLPKVISPPGAAQASPGAKEKPSAEKVQAILDRLGAAGIKTTADDFNALADKYGVGGAVRALAFAHAAGKSTSDITAMVDAGKGWGQIRRELKLTISPGIGWLMGHGHDKADKADNANGEKKDKADAGADADDVSESAETDDDPADD
jgi:hypothetical protein